MKTSTSVLLSLFTLAACKSDGASKKATDPKSTAHSTLVKDGATVADIDAGPLVLAPATPLPATPTGLPSTQGPEHNPTTAEKVALGALLFVDPALSGTGTKSCSSCHRPERAFSSQAPFDTNDDKILNRRHTPSLVNLAYHEEFYWDGRAQPLESLVLGHWKGQLDSEPEALARKLAGHPLYAAHFERAFGGEASAHRSAEAIASFLRAIRSGGSDWDRYEAGDTDAVSPEAIAGAEVFNKRAGCAVCHAPPLYTDLRYHHLGVPQAADAPDEGRYLVTRRTNDKGAFKTPGLRGVLKTAPYFHNGSADSLDKVLEYKEALGSPKLSSDERAQLVAFLESLEAELPMTLVPDPPTWPEVAAPDTAESDSP